MLFSEVPRSKVEAPTGLAIMTLNETLNVDPQLRRVLEHARDHNILVLDNELSHLDDAYPGLIRAIKAGLVWDMQGGGWGVGADYRLTSAGIKALGIETDGFLRTTVGAIKDFVLRASRTSRNMDAVVVLDPNDSDAADVTRK